MALTEEERRRYFRIEDTVRVAYEVVTESEASRREEEMARTDYAAPNRLQQTERHLQLLIDKLRVQNPEYAEAIELLNIKFNCLKETGATERGGYRSKSEVKKVSISACGISFDEDDRFDVGAKLYMDLILLPTDFHIHTLGKVVDCLPHGEATGEWVVRVDFYGLRSEDEEFLVQHIVKRQARLLRTTREDS